MIPYETVAVVGGDLRQAHIANRLSERGKKVYAMLLEDNTALSPSLRCNDFSCLRECGAVILPMPLSADGQTIHAPFSGKKADVNAIFSMLRPQTAIFAGRVSPEVRRAALDYGLRIRDYLEREDLAIQNAAITAEGALALAIDELPISLIGANILVTGYGRIAKALLQRLCAMGAHVAAAARKCGDRAEIVTRGCEACKMEELEEAVKGADVIFNTVPAPLFTREILSAIRQDTLLIDLASKPGGDGGSIA